MKKHPKLTKSSQSRKTKSLKNELEGDELWYAFTTEITPLVHRKRHAEINAREYPSIQKTPARIDTCLVFWSALIVLEKERF